VSGAPLPWTEALALLAQATDRATLQAAVAAARIGEDLHDWRRLRDLQALLPDSIRWGVDRTLWNAGVRTVTELLEEREPWRVFARRLSEEEQQALVDAIRSIAADAVRQRHRDGMLGDVAAEQERVAGTVAPACPEDELAAWAAHLGATDLLSAPASDALSDRGEPNVQVFLRRSRAWKPTVASVVAGPTWESVGRRKGRGAPLDVQTACLDWVRMQAARRKVAGDDEAAWLAEVADTAPDVASLNGWFGGLLALRGQLRTELPPALRLDRVPAEVRVVDEPRRVEVALARGVGSQCGKSPILSLPLESRPVAEVRCVCGGPRGATCPSALQAVDVALDMLRAPGPNRDACRTLLERPRWHGVLSDLESLATASERLTNAPVLGWRLTGEGIDTEIEPVALTPLKSGGFRTRSLAAAEIDDAVDASADARDARVAGLVVGASASGALHWRTRTRFALRELVGHPRVFVGARGREPVDVIEADLAVVVARDGDALQVDLSLDGRPVHDDVLAELADHRGSAGPPFLALGARVVVLRVAREVGALAALLLRRGNRMEGGATEPLLEALHRIEHAVPVELDADLRGEAVPRDDRLLVRLELRSQGTLHLSMRVRPLADGPVLRPGSGRRFVHRAGEGRGHVQRDLPAERRQATDLAQDLGLDGAEDGVIDWTIPDPLAAAEAVARLENLSAEARGPVVEWTGRPMRFTTAGGGALRVGVRSMEQWFGLDGTLSVGDAEISLERLLEILESGRRFVEVGDGDWVRIDESLAKALEQATAGAFLHRGKRVISPLHAPALDGLSRAGVRVETAPEWTMSSEAIREAEGLKWAAPPDFSGTLRAYQAEGAGWIARCARWAPGCCLADDMGLGKTVQTLAVLAGRTDAGPTLVVAPASVGFNWLRETATFAPGLRARAYRGPDREELLDGLEGTDLLVVSWSLLARDIERLAEVRFGTVVFDEAQAAKNPSSARWAAARSLKAGFRLALTGTPVENRPEDLWALFTILAPGLLGSREAFRRRYALPIGRGEEPPRHRLAQLVRPLMLRRLKKDVATELPPRTEVDVHVQLGVDERRLYDEVRTTGLQALKFKTKDDQLRFQALALLTKLRQAACNPRLVEFDTAVPSAKLRRVRELVRELHDGGHQALLFSQFLGHLALVQEALEHDGLRVRRIDGGTPMEARQREIDAFQAGDGDVFLISLKAGGVGLNLTAASYVFHLDPWWNPAVEDQATDRAHRIGQEKPVTVYRLIARDTVEEGIVALHKTKRRMVEDLLAGTGSGSKLGADEILGLLGA